MKGLPWFSSNRPPHPTPPPHPRPCPPRCRSRRWVFQNECWSRPKQCLLSACQPSPNGPLLFSKTINTPNCSRSVRSLSSDRSLLSLICPPPPLLLLKEHYHFPVWWSHNIFSFIRQSRRYERQKKAASKATGQFDFHLPLSFFWTLMSWRLKVVPKKLNTCLKSYLFLILVS